MGISKSAITETLQRLMRSRTPGKLSDPDPFDITLTKRPANREDILMTKNKDGDGYDFANVGDSVKNALALSYEALKDPAVMDTLPDDVVEFYKSAKEELDFEVSRSKQDDDKHDDSSDDSDDKEDGKDTDTNRLIEVVKSALPDAFAKMTEEVKKPLEIELKKTQDEVAALTGRLEQEEMQKVAKSLMPNGDEPGEEKIAELTIIRKSMSDDQWTKYLEGQRSNKVLVEKAALFERQSNPQATVSGSAHDELKKIADSIVEKSENKDPTKAWEVAIHQNPTLYEQYRKEQAAQAKA